MIHLEAVGETLELLPERAIWWAAQETLFVADLHVGKDEAIRASGIALPPGQTEDDLRRLARLAQHHAARRLVVLGDFLHARSSRSAPVWRSLRDWRTEIAGVDLLLVRGNHDRSAGDPPPDLGIDVVDNGARLGPFGLFHEPPFGGFAPRPGGGRSASGGVTPPRAGSAAVPPADGAAPYRLAGHLHPAIRLRGAGADRLKTPVFLEHRPPAEAPCLVLPAFSTFTGGAVMRPGPHDRVWAVGNEGVVAIR